MAEDKDTAATSEVLAFLERASRGSLADAVDATAIAESVARRAGVKRADVQPLVALIRTALTRETDLDLDGFRIRAVRRIGAGLCEVVGDSGTGDDWVRFRLTVRRKAGRWRIVEYRDMSGSIGLLDALVLGVTAARQGDRDVVRAVSAMMRVRDADVDAESKELIAIMEEVAEVKLPVRFDAARHIVVAMLKNEDDPKGALASANRALELQPGLPYALLIKASVLTDLERPAEALPLCAQHRKAIGDNAAARAFEVDALGALDRLEEAKAACVAGLDEEVRPDLVARYATLLPEDGKAGIVPFLVELGPPGDVLGELCDALTERDQWRAVEIVCARARLRIPDHSDVAYYDALAKLGTDRAEVAARIVYPAIATAPEDGRPLFVELYLDAMLLQDKGLAAYGRLAAQDRQAGFAYLARELWNEDRYDELRTLARRHRTETRELGLILVWETELLWNDDKMAELVAFVRKHRVALARVEGDDAWMPNDRLLRALLELKRIGEAVREAERIAAAEEDSFYLVMVYAAAGRTEDAIRCFREAIANNGHDPEDLFEDSVIGPLLRKPAFKELHKKYPPPPIKSDEEEDG